MQADDNAPRERLTARFARGPERRRWQQQRLPLGAYQALARVRAAVDAGTRDESTPQDVRDALTLLPGLRDELDSAEARLIEAARDRGASWAVLATPLGVRSRQAAEQRYRRLTGGHQATRPDRVRDPGPARRDRRDPPRRRAADTRAKPDAGAAPAPPDRAPGPAGTARRRPSPPARTPAPARPGTRGDPAPPAVNAAAGGEAAYQMRRASDYATTGGWTVLAGVSGLADLAA